jgi:tetratricopeptide (TPR) repeat protein
MLQPSTRSRSPLATLLGLLVLMLSMAMAGSAHAQAGDDDPEVMVQAKEHYKAGLAAYNDGKYDVAIRELKKAYLLKRLPPLLLNIGATYRKSGDIDLSLHFYQKYLDEAPSDAKDRGDVEQIIAELKTQKAGSDADSAAKATEDVAPAPRRGAVEWSHTVIEAAPPETPIDVRVTAPAMKGVKVFVYYRG